MKNSVNNKQVLILTLLILSGEFIYFLPYVLSRVFRPTFLDVFQLNNLQFEVIERKVNRAVETLPFQLTQN